MAKDKDDKALPVLEEKTIEEWAAGTSPVLEEKTIEEWAAGTRTPIWVLEGLKVRQNWAAGKVITEKEYQKALKNFLAGPLVKKG